MTTVSHILQHLNNVAPFVYQESYDNSGLIVGDHTREVTGVLVALDCTEAVVDEAIVLGANVIVAHHPIVFKGLKRLTGSNYVERTVIKAIEHKIALIAVHTNLDHMPDGVNAVIADKLKLKDQQILSPKAGILNKLVVFVPELQKAVVAEVLFAAGAGKIGNYDSCSFSTEGAGTFRPLEGADPFIGAIGEMEKVMESRLEVLVPQDRLPAVIAAMLEAHPYEEVAYDVIPVSNAHARIGAGMVGDLETPVAALDFLKEVKATFRCGTIRYTDLMNKTIRRVAVCGGAGGFLLQDAIRAKADIFITADYKYHEFFDADGQIIIADIGHFESEHYTSELLVALLTKKFSNFAVRLTNVNTNPIKYL